jgi:hypothetical protein
MVNKLDSNQSGLSIAEEATLRTLPGTPVWFPLEPNSYSDFAGDTKTAERAPINAGRQNFRSVVTGQDASGGFNSDFLQAGMFRLMQGYMFADAHEKADTQPTKTATSVALIDVTSTAYEATTGLAGFPVNALVLASHFTNSANNGLKLVTASAAGSLSAAGLVAEASPPATAKLEQVGYRAASGDLTLTVSASVLTMSSTALDFTTLGLNLGEWLFIGGDASVNQFVSAANKGFARIRSIAAHAITFDETTFTPVNDAGTAKLVDLYFGKFLRNESDPTLIKRRTYNLERTLGNNGTGQQAEYLEGSVADEVDFTLGLEAIATADFKFVSCAHTVRNGTQGLKFGTRVAQTVSKAYNTSSDVYRLQVAPAYAGSLNAAGAFGYVNEAKLAIKNSVAATKAIGAGLYAVDTTAGNFDFSGSITAYFTDVASCIAINNNTDMEFNAIMAANNQGCVFDAPMLGLGGGKIAVTKDKEITIPVDLKAAAGDLNYTLSLTQFAYLPTVAMPVFV